MVTNKLLLAAVLTCIAYTLAISSLLKSDVQLDLLSSYSTISQSKYQQYPDLYDSQKSTIQGSFSASLFETSQAKLLFSGCENFYAPYADTYPSVVFYNVSSDSIVEASRLSVPAGTGQTNGLVSTTANNRYVAISRYTPIGFVSPFVSQSFQIYIYNYSEAGIIGSTPVTVYDMSQLAVNFYSSSVSYNGLSGISSDGKWLMATYAVGFPIIGAITGQKHVLLRVSSDHATITASVTIDTLPTGFPRLFSFPQKTVLYPTASNPTKYHFVSADNSWNLTSPLGFTASVTSYIFDSVANTLTFADSSYVAQYIEGFDVDSKNSIVYSITNEVSSNGVSTLQFPRIPYDNAAVDKNSELRAWKLSDNGNLTYRGGLEIGGDGVQVRPSPNGKYLAVTYAGIIDNDVEYTTFVGFGNISRTYAPTVVNLYQVKARDDYLSLDLLDSSPASPLSFGLTFDAQSSELAVVGQSTYRVLPNGFNVGQKDVQLYRLLYQDN